MAATARTPRIITLPKLTFLSRGRPELPLEETERQPSKGNTTMNVQTISRASAYKFRPVSSRREAAEAIFAKRKPAAVAAEETPHQKALRLIRSGEIEAGCRLATKLINDGEESGFLVYNRTPAQSTAESWLVSSLTEAQRDPLTEVVNITPDRAQVLLRCNTNNRRVRAANLVSIIRDIVNGRWDLNGESLIVSKTGKLNDGQHRLFAVILSGKHIKSVMTFGVTDESMATVDIGEKRTNADRFNLRGESDYVVAAAISGLAFEMEAGRAGTTTEIMEWFERHRAEVLEANSAKGSNIRGLGPSIAGVTAMHLLSLGAKPESIREFFNVVRTAEMTKSGNAARTIHLALFPTERGRPPMKQKRPDWVAILCNHYINWAKNRKTPDVLVASPMPKSL